MLSIREWAREYISRGWAIARIAPGEKQPTDRGWTRRSCRPEDIPDGWNLGIQSGRLSGDLVCVDIDDLGAVAKADLFLPSTGLEEGRPGKPRSHRWYKVVDIPPAFTATCAGGIGGPRTLPF